MKALILAVALTSLTGSLAVAAELEPEKFGGGKCEDMASKHKAEDLWVGRFAARISGSTDVSNVACFTDKMDCVNWLGGDAAQKVNFEEFFEYSCRKGWKG